LELEEPLPPSTLSISLMNDMMTTLKERTKADDIDDDE
jgi:hypothetical protein